jgi:hypothetical protein
MRPNFSQAAKRFFSPETFVPFLIGAITLSVVGNTITLILINWLGTSIKILVMIVCGALIILVLSVLIFALNLMRLRSQNLSLNEYAPAKRRGLILLVSHLEICRKAISYHQPKLEICWLICSTRSLPEAESLSREFAEVQMPPPTVINNINDPMDFFHHVKEIYSHLPEGWNDADVIADYTGMTSHGSVGMALACMSPQRPLQYTPAEVDDHLRPVNPLDPIEVVLNWEELGIAQPAKASHTIKH